MKKYFYLSLGSLSFALGTAGIVLPVLPTVPFYLLSAYSFSKSSPRLHQWFLQTTLYQNHLADYVKGHGMTRQTKRRAMLTITLTMGISLWMVRHHFWLALMLTLIWLGLMSYFLVKVKTI